VVDLDIHVFQTFVEINPVGGLIERTADFYIAGGVVVKDGRWRNTAADTDDGSGREGVAAEVDDHVGATYFGNGQVVAGGTTGTELGDRAADGYLIANGDGGRGIGEDKNGFRGRIIVIGIRLLNVKAVEANRGDDGGGDNDRLAD